MQKLSEGFMKKTAITIRDVSARCGLSVSTVSKALNNYSDVSAETRELVHRTAREIGYHPNAIARTLKTNRSSNLGVLFQTESGLGLTHHFFAAVLNAFKTASEARGYDITFINRNIGDRGMSYLEHCRWRNVDGVVIVCADFDSPEVQELAHSGFPCVTIDREYEGCCCVLNENASGIAQLVRHAAGLGHRRIALVRGNPAAVTTERVEGYRSAMSELGLPIYEGYEEEGQYTFPNAAHDAVIRLMKLPSPPTCILVPDDFASLGARGALEELGLKFGEDVSIGGYDGITLTQMLNPRLTTIQQDTQRAGREAADMLISLIESPCPLPPRRVVVPGKLIVGESITPPKG